MAKKNNPTLGASTGGDTGGGTTATCTSGATAENEKSRALQAILHVAQNYPIAGALPTVFCGALQNPGALWPELVPPLQTLGGDSGGTGGDTNSGGTSCYTGLTIAQALKKSFKTHFESWAGYAGSTPSAMKQGVDSACSVGWQQSGQVYANRF